MVFLLPCTTPMLQMAHYLSQKLPLTCDVAMAMLSELCSNSNHLKPLTRVLVTALMNVCTRASSGTATCCWLICMNASAAASTLQHRRCHFQPNICVSAARARRFRPLPARNWRRCTLSEGMTESGMTSRHLDCAAGSSAAACRHAAARSAGFSVTWDCGLRQTMDNCFSQVLTELVSEYSAGSQ